MPLCAADFRNLIACIWGTQRLGSAEGGFSAKTMEGYKLRLTNESKPNRAAFHYRLLPGNIPEPNLHYQPNASSCSRDLNGANVAERKKRIDTRSREGRFGNDSCRPDHMRRQKICPSSAAGKSDLDNTDSFNLWFIWPPADLELKFRNVDP